MRDWLCKYTIEVDSEYTQDGNSYQTALALIQEQLATLQEQQDKICTLLEQGVYTVEMFSKRNDSISKELKRLQSDEADLLGKLSDQEAGEDSRRNIIPTTQHILDSYDVLTIEEKNLLWKTVLEKITVFRTKSDKFSIHVYPKVPMQ